MKKIFVILLALISITAEAQYCDQSFTGTFSVGWGLTSKKESGMKVEAGVWGLNNPITASIGFDAIAILEDTTGFNKSSYTPGNIITFGAYIRLGIITYRSENRRLFNEAAFNASAKPALSYSIYYKPIDGATMLIGLEPFYNFKYRTGGVFLTVKGGF
jgi:hypothetical protein